MSGASAATSTIGSAQYVVIAYCPTLSFANLSTGRMSGLCAFQTANPNDSTLGGQLVWTTLVTPPTAISMIGAYGSNGSNFASQLGVWSASATLGLLMPEPTRTGVAYFGKILFGQLQGPMTVQNLIDIADKQ